MALKKQLLKIQETLDKPGKWVYLHKQIIPIRNKGI